MGPRFLLACALVGTLLVFLADSGRESESLFAEAHEAMRADDYETAARLFREITITFPGSPLAASAHYELAEIYHLRIRDAAATEASLLKILSDYPDSALRAPAHRLLGQIYERDLRAPEKALSHYHEVLREPELPVAHEREVLLALGDCYYRLDENAKAAESYRRALELPYDPSSEGAYLRLATLSRLEGDSEEALERLRELAARTGEPRRRYEALHQEIELLIELERFQEASERLHEARAGFPESAALAELAERLEAGQVRAASFETEEATLEELQKRIHWGAGRRPPPRERP
jgi:TolA-binding protein